MARASRGSEQLQAKDPARESRGTKTRLGEPGQHNQRSAGVANVPHEASEVAACRASGAFSSADLADGTRFLSIAQVARMLSVDGHVVSPDSVRVWIRVGTTAKGSHRTKVQPVKLRATVLPHGRVVSREDLAAFLAELTARYDRLPPRAQLDRGLKARAPAGDGDGGGVKIGAAVYPEPRGRKGVAWA